MKRPWSPLILVPLMLTACSGVADLSPIGAVARAELRDTTGRVVGQATFTQVQGGVRIVLEAQGLPPGVKGVHLHALGKCEPPDFASAGGHLNPRDKQHGLLNPAGPHAGDLANITVEADGRGRLETFTERVTLATGATSLFDDDGTALVVHAAADDFKTDPSGNTGPRIACGVVEKPPQNP